MIRADRIHQDIAAIAAITQTPGNGATRPTFSAEWGQAWDYVLAESKKIDCISRVDGAGNIFIKPRALPASTPSWLCGSHLDTVPHGGDYDGVAGVVAALELLRSAHEDGVTLPLELVIFAEEEGPTFGLGMLGSRTFVGELTVEQLATLRNKEGQTYPEAGEPFGVVPDQIAACRLHPASHLGFIELHIEQGPGMWRRDQRVAIVTAIAGRQQYLVSLTGEANHAGATAMGDRKDALVAAAEIVAKLESLAKTISADAVATVGRLNVLPNAINVIPDRVEFTIDFRAPTDEQLRAGDVAIADLVRETCMERMMPVTLRRTEAIPARPMNPKLVVALDAGFPLVVSGALHDSAVLAPYLPTVMLFVPSEGGISHNPAEFSRVEDIAAGAQVIEKLVRRPTMAMLNTMHRDAFVGVAGRFYEHSPWIAERAAASRPFASRAALQQAMADVVASASVEEQLALIRAHPDLVGRMSSSRLREGAGGGSSEPLDADISPIDRPPPQPSPASGRGRLTSESTTEQAAAGLSTLSPEEVVAFEQFNAAYHDKFGFPFVICARQNKKAAILAAFPTRLKNAVEQEIATAVTEIHKIASLRIADAIWDENA